MLHVRGVDGLEDLLLTEGRRSPTESILSLWRSGFNMLENDIKSELNHEFVSWWFINL